MLSLDKISKIINKEKSIILTYGTLGYFALVVAGLTIDYYNIAYIGLDLSAADLDYLGITVNAAFDLIWLISCAFLIILTNELLSKRKVKNKKKKIEEQNSTLILRNDEGLSDSNEGSHANEKQIAKPKSNTKRKCSFIMDITCNIYTKLRGLIKMFCVWVFDKWNEYYYIILGFFLLLILIILYKYDEILLFYSWYNNSRIFVLMIACVVFVITVALFINKKLSDRIDNNIGKSILFLCIITVAQFIYNLAATRNTIYEKILGFDEKPLFFVCENYDYIFLLLLVSVLQIFSYISCYIAGLRLFFVFVGFDCVNKDIGSYFSKSIIDINDKGNLRLVTAFEKKFNTPIANEQNFLLVYVIKYICIFVSIVGVILPLFLYGNGMRNPFYWQNLARVNVVVREDLHLSDNYLFSADLLRRTENGVYIRGNLYCTISGCYKYNNDAILKIVPKYIIKNEKGSVVIGISREELPIIDWAICKQKCFDYMEFTKKYMEYKVCHIRN